jgi:hypothetical protein
MEVASGFQKYILCAFAEAISIPSERFASGIHVKSNAACVPLTLSYSPEGSPALALCVQASFSLNRLKLSGFLYNLLPVVEVLKLALKSMDLQ